MTDNYKPKTVTKYEGPYGQLYDTPEEAAEDYTMKRIENLITPPLKDLRPGYSSSSYVEDAISFRRRSARHIYNNREKVIAFLQSLDGDLMTETPHD